ncbi:MAG: hypothetical protein FWD67_04340 [Betaproteobacteria bacterium]|nr:hypothetical protein [Betaproteobacteria bacterium]
METTKITVKVFERMLVGFDRQIDSLFIKRDGFLNSVISKEIRNLEADLAGRRNSAVAKRHIAAKLKMMGTRTVNIVVDKTTADALNKVVKEFNLVRDALVNRLILMLRSPRIFLRWMDLPEVINGSQFESMIEQMPTSPMEALKSIHDDPLYYLRAGCEERHETGLYLIDLPDDFLGFSCILDDSRIPGTEAHEKRVREADELLASLLSFEENAFSGTAEDKG